jgi:hypothetical protein
MIKRQDSSTRETKKNLPSIFQMEASKYPSIYI